jgi:hypothetical protein
MLLYLRSFHTRNGALKQICCKAHPLGHNQLLVVCKKCSSHSAAGTGTVGTAGSCCRSAYRCVACYHAFQVAINERMTKLSKSSTNWIKKLPPSLQALLEIQWKDLVCLSADDEPSKSIYGEHLSLIVQHGGRFMLQWKQACPSCYNWDFPCLPPVDPSFEAFFANTEPKVERRAILLNKVNALDPVTGVYITKTINLIVDTVKVVISQQEAERFKYRYADERLHRKYKFLCVSEEDRLLLSSGGQQLWHLVRTDQTRQEPSIALSLNWIGGLTEIKNELPGGERAFSLHFGKVHRRSAPYKKKNSGLLPDSLLMWTNYLFKYVFSV